MVDFTPDEHGGADKGGEKDEGPIENDEHENGAKNHPDKDSEPVPFRSTKVFGEVNAEKRSSACSRQSDHELLEEERDDGTRQPSEQSEKNSPLLVNGQGRGIREDGEAQSKSHGGDEKPVQFATRQEHSQSKKREERDRQVGQVGQMGAFHVPRVSKAGHLEDYKMPEKFEGEMEQRIGQAEEFTE